MKKERPLILIVLTIVLCISTFIASILYFMNYQKRFSAFLIKLSNSTKTIAHVVSDNDEYQLLTDNKYKLYSWIIVYGPGKELFFKPSGATENVKIVYKDGATLIISEKEDKVYFDYRNQDYHHSFYSDECSLERFKKEILDKDLNIPHQLKDN